MAIETADGPGPSKSTSTPKGMGESSHRPSTPPPTYSVSVAGSSTTEGTSRSGAGPSGYYVSPAVGGPGYGPTPLGGGHGHAGGERAIILGNGVVPFYDPNSSHSILAARSRARWRFIEAFMYAIIIWTAVGLFFGAGIKWDLDWKRERDRQRHGGH